MLTTQQQSAIQKTKGPCIILAGAGTGKTHTIVEKTKYLLKNAKIPAEKIILITFSNEACNSIQTRIQKVLPEKAKPPIIKTFHAFSADLIREHQNNKFKIISPDDAKIILHTNLKIPASNCHRYISTIGNAKDLGVTKEKFQEFLNKKLSKFQEKNLEKQLENFQFQFQTLHLQSAKKDKHEITTKIKELSDIIKQQKFLKAWNAYEKLKTLKNYQDYSDLNNNALNLLKQKPEIATKYEYLIVDEFQDTNKIQIDLLKVLTPHKNITIVGDINQSIYRFRGAYQNNLHEFKKHFNITKKEIFALSDSYRSSNKILRTAHKLILNNYQNPEECFEVKNAQNREGNKIKIFKLNDSKEEARKVAEIIEEKISNNEDPNQICVMFRNHQYGKIIKKALEFKNIQFCSITKASLLDQNSIKILINYLQILNKLKQKLDGGEQAWWELLYSFNFSEKDLIKIGKFIKENKTSENISVFLLNNLSNLEISNDGRQRTKLFIERLKIMIPAIFKPLKEIIKHVFHCSGLLTPEKTKENQEVSLNFNKFYELAQTHEKIYETELSDFLRHLSIIKDLKIEIPAAEIEENGIRLMTLHSTKGLEYQTVILTNLSQKRFPMEQTTTNSLLPLELTQEIPLNENEEYFSHEIERINQLTEERRLCYVAFTRAKNELILTFAEKYGNKKFFPSQFLNEINFQKNENINYLIDDKTLYEESEIQITTANNFASIQKNDFQNIAKPEIEEKKSHFSPTALLMFADCQKKYEYKYIFNMPEEKSSNWEAIHLGSFVHKVLENGVKDKLKTAEEFINYAKEIHLKDDWNSIELENAIHLIKVFHERNKNKFNENSKTEQYLSIEIEGIKFIGFADRIDFSNEGVEIIDYKTGNSNVSPKSRNWQLGLYALASEELGKVHKITLDMLKHEKPLEFIVDEKGNAKSEYGRMEFNIKEVKEELVLTAKQILKAKKEGFKPCPLEKNCEFCNRFVYEPHNQKAARIST